MAHCVPRRSPERASPSRRPATPPARRALRALRKGENGAEEDDRHARRVLDPGLPDAGAWGAVQATPKTTKPKAKTTTVTAPGRRSSASAGAPLIIRIKAQKTVNGRSRQAQDPRRSTTRSTRRHVPLQVHQRPGAAAPDRGGARGPGPERRDDLGRDRRHDLLQAVADGRDPGGQEGVAAPRGGAARHPSRRDDHGHADRRRRARRRRRRRAARPRVRLVPRGRRGLQHLQGRQRDQPPEPRRARAARVPRGRAPGDRALPRAASTRPTATSTPRRSCPGRSTRRASSRAGRSTAPRICSTRRASRNYAVNAGGDIRLRGGAVPEPLWRVGIQHPQIRDRIAAVVEANDLAVATSGAYVARRARRRPAHRPPARRACSRSRSPAPTSARPTPTRPPRSRWARPGPSGRAGSRPTRR